MQLPKLDALFVASTGIRGVSCRVEADSGVSAHGCGVDQRDWRRRSLLGLFFAGAALTACDVSGSGDAGSPLDTSARVREIPLSGLTSKDEIRGTDFAIDDSARLQILCGVALRNQAGVLPRERTLLVRGVLPAGPWSEHVVQVGPAGAPHILSSPDGLHALVGIPLRYLFSGDGGDTWVDRGEVLPGAPPGSIQADFVWSSDHVVVACIVHPNAPYAPEERGEDHAQRLYLCEWTLDGLARAPVEIASFPAALSEPTAPRLSADGEVLHLVLGLNENVVSPAGAAGAPSQTIQGRVVYTTSRDGGRHWSGPEVVAASLDGVRGVDLLAGDNGVQAFFTSHGVFAASRIDGAWSLPVRVNPYATKLLRGTDAASHVSAAGGASGVAIVWTDERDRASDARPSNPLGGLPWSDDSMLLANNDVFVRWFPAPHALVVPGDEGRPLQLTTTGGFALEPRVRMHAADAIVLWSGVTQVGRSRHSAGTPPALFLYRSKD